MAVLQTGQIGVIATVNVALDKKRKQDLAVIQLHNMAEKNVLVKQEDFKTVLCLIVQLIQITQSGLVGVYAMYHVVMVSRQRLDIVQVMQVVKDQHNKLRNVYCLHVQVSVIL